MTFGRRFGLLGFLLLLGVSPYVVTPAYIGYLFAFALLLGTMAAGAWVHLDVGRKFPAVYLALIGWLALVLINSAIRQVQPWDAFRDAGTLLAFVIGRFAVIAFARRRAIGMLETLSVAGLLTTGATFAGAFLAYRAGADAYFWRGAYVPTVHSWLPYFLAVNSSLVQLAPHRRRRYVTRAALCVMGTLASLSRTDMLLEAMFVLILLFQHRAYLFNSGRKLILAALLLPALGGGLAAFSQLDVVQQRVQVGVDDEEDLSLGWRVIENFALLDYIQSADRLAGAFGFGLGARVPLPAGIVDFDGNDSIPYLHNSLLTIVLKAGVFGLIVYSAYFFTMLKRALRNKRDEWGPVGLAGAWILIFNFGKAVTLQGLSDWGHVMFFGVGCALIAFVSAAKSDLALKRQLP